MAIEIKREGERMKVVTLDSTHAAKHNFKNLSLSIKYRSPEEILLKTIDSFVVNSNFCEPPYMVNYRLLKKRL